MIVTLPERSRKSIAAIRQDLEFIASSCRASRPLSKVCILGWITDILELWPDLEEDLLADLEAAREEGEIWHPDDLVVLGPQGGGDCQ